MTADTVIPGTRQRQPGMDELRIVLRCTGCRAYTAFDRVGESAVKCAECGKRHSTDSLHAVGPDEEARFD